MRYFRGASAVVLPLALAFATAAPMRAAAQSVGAVRDLLRQEAQFLGLGASLQGLAGFGALPGISAANFSIDRAGQPDAALNRINFAPSHRFESVRLLGGTLYAEASLGYLDADIVYNGFLPGTRFAGNAESKLTAVSVIPGVGLSFPVSERLRITPIAMAGFSRVDDTTTFSGANPRRLDRATRGILFNYRVDEFLYGAAIQADYDRALPGDVNLHADARYNQMFSRTLHASDPALEGDGTFGVLTAHVEADGPTGATAFGREVRWIGFAANSTFTGDAANALGFDWFVELGAGVEFVDRAVVEGLEGASLRASVILGDGVTGWTLGAQLEF